MARARTAPRQESLPGAEYKREERPEIEEAAEDLRAVNASISQLNEKKRVTAGVLLQKLTEAGIIVHKYPDADGIQRCARIVATPRARVEREKGDKAAKLSGDEGDETGEDGGAEVH